MTFGLPQKRDRTIEVPLAYAAQEQIGTNIFQRIDQLIGTLNRLAAPCCCIIDRLERQKRIDTAGRGRCAPLLGTLGLRPLVGTEHLSRLLGRSTRAPAAQNDPPCPVNPHLELATYG